MLGILIYISGLKSDRVIATIYNDTEEFTVQRKQAMIKGNFESFHEYGKTYIFKQNFKARNLIGMRGDTFISLSILDQILSDELP